MKKLSEYKSLILILLAALLLGLNAQAQESERPASEYALNFGAVYGAQWAFYLVSQKEIIEDRGSWDNWTSYPFKPDFDKDSFDYNIFKHSLAGQYYYHFYRYRGYSEIEAFTWTFLSSLAFEFTIETYTEKPSLQDIYQTPIYGTIVGMGTERLSKYLLAQDSYFAHFFAYILNPFELLANSEEVHFVPYSDHSDAGFLLSWRY